MSMMKRVILKFYSAVFKDNISNQESYCVKKSTRTILMCYDM